MNYKLQKGMRLLLNEPMEWELLKQLHPEWILGYSDISTLAFIYSKITGNVSAHGTNFNELSAPKWDAVTSKWTDVLGCSEKKEVIQYSSNYYQTSWEKTFKNPEQGFNFDK